MNEPAASLSCGAIHKFARAREPGWSHYHRLSALPVDFALPDTFVLEMIEQTTGKQGQESQGKTVRFLALEAVVACDVAIRRR